ncbi:5-formyltetrahydrofolate cyclo-ligase [uncultured Shewanella sp.]|uniref:5-formyltetrahydrofolate cyclo-ligase n=1 Tax=uncultured Shewanella sp. TaxID=173975 RepID=UPI0026107388|nr:5-formyltetrahydrofolate cyclo-ligase [uncultured Shewanella sp.]
MVKSSPPVEYISDPLDLMHSLYSSSDIRKTIRRRRRAISFDRQQAMSLKASQLILMQAPMLTAKHVALYLSQDGELDTKPLIEALWQKGIQIYLPRLHPFCSGHLLFLHFHENTPLLPNRFGILEPALHVTNVMPIENLDVMVTPLVAFDVNGQRVGMGGGYYDRTLAHWRERNKPVPIGYAHDCQQVSHIEAQPWDMPLPYIVTPTKVIYNT